MIRTRRINGCNVVFLRSGHGWGAGFHGRRENRNGMINHTFHGVLYARRLADLRRSVHALIARP